MLTFKGKNIYCIYKGKPVEKQGRKAKGLRSQKKDYDSRLPH